MKLFRKRSAALLFGVASFVSLWAGTAHADTSVLYFPVGSGTLTNTTKMSHSDPMETCNYSYSYWAQVTAKANSSSGASAMYWSSIKGYSGTYSSPSGTQVYRDNSYIVDRYNDITYRYTSTWCKTVSTDFTISVGKTVGSSSGQEPYYETVVAKLSGCPMSTWCQDVDTIQIQPN